MTLRNIPVGGVGVKRRCVMCGKRSSSDAGFGKAY